MTKDPRSKSLKSRLTRRLVAGLLLCIPVGVVLFALVELYNLAILVIDPVMVFLDDDSPLGALVLNLAGVLAVLAFIYGLGFLADLPFVAKRVDRLDQTLASFVPGYSMVKGMIAGVVDEQTMLDGLRPVVVDTMGGQSVGFEVERTDQGNVVVFLPNSPSVGSGRVMVFDTNRVTRLNVPPHRVADMMSFHGRGMIRDIEAAAGKARPDGQGGA